MTTPALQRLRERFPRASITLLTHEKLADLWLHHPSIDDVITFQSDQSIFSVARRIRESGAEGHTPTTWPDAPRSTLDALGQSGPDRSSPDVALLFPNSHRAALELYLARIPRRIGYSRPWRNFLLTDPIPIRPGHKRMRKLSPREIHRRISVGTSSTSSPLNPNTIHRPALAAPKQTGGGSTIPADHQVHDHLHLVSALGADPTPLPPLLVVQPAELEAVAAKFHLSDPSSIIHHPSSSTSHPPSSLPSPLTIRHSPLFALCPGAEYGPAKRWPLDRFINAAREIQKRIHCTWLLLGSKADQPLTAEIHSALQSSISQLPSPTLDLAGQTTLRELMSLLKLCRVLLTNDSGPMHLAAALGTPVVVPFGSTSSELTGPLPGDPMGSPGTLPHGRGSDRMQHQILKSTAPCSPCFLRTCPIDFRCMNSITVESVVEAVVQALIILRP